MNDRYRKCLIGLGSNLGDRKLNLDSAVRQFDQIDGVSVTAVSKWFGTEPIGGPSDQGGFLNGAATLETTLEPADLLDQLRNVETSLGRERRIRWDARTLDVDILLFEDLCLRTNELTIPHPRMICRRFVLEPAADIASAWLHPTQNWTVGQLFEHLQVAPPRFVLCGFGQRGLGNQVSQIIAKSQTGLLATTDFGTEQECSADTVERQLESDGDLRDDKQGSSEHGTVVPFESTDVGTLASISPKLFIVPTGVGSVEQQQEAHELQNDLIHLQVAPVLAIASSDPDVVVAESVAAVEAMR